MKTINNRTIIIAGITLLVGLLAGWLIFGGSQPSEQGEHDHEITQEADETTYTCSMHPQIRQNEPGDCPICGMDLIPVDEEQSDQVDPDAIQMSQTAMKLAGVQTAMAEKKEPVKNVRLTGKVQADERRVYMQSSHIAGRIEKLNVNYTGAYVQEGEVIARVYSPDLVTAQEELLEASKIKEEQPQMYNAAVEKLKSWKLSKGQINRIAESKSIRESFPVTADVSGYVTRKMVNRGDYISAGEAFYEVADLSEVWVLLDVYESDMPWLNKGDEVTFTVSALPGRQFDGTIAYIDPVINPETHVAKARVEVKNPERHLKPEMFTSATVRARLQDYEQAVVVPTSAVMWTGKRSVVYVKHSTDQEVSFLMREVTLGPSLGDRYVITEGLGEGDEIAVNGTFSIDAAAQLAGKPAMMNREGGKPATGHNHGDMDMDDEEASAETIDVENRQPTPEAFKKQLTQVYQAYLTMKDAYVDSDGEAVARHAGEVIGRLDDVDMGLLEGNAHRQWMNNSETLQELLEKITGTKDLEKQRKVFVDFNLAFYEVVDRFGLSGVKTYYQYCPMADNDNGAYWFSDEEPIRNPYYGDQMLKCGEVREVIEE